MLREFRRRTERAAAFAAVVLVVIALAQPAGATSLLDPALRFRAVSTPHFIIYFHRGEERLAARLAVIAEDVWPRIGSALGVQAPRRTHVILADQSDNANGWATPLPYDTIFINASAPAGSEFIGHTDDWLRQVFTHEFTHIVHQDRSEGWARGFRTVFGRSPIAFPNVWLPTWQVEGIAVWEESNLTGKGRLYAGDFRAVEYEAARHERMEPLDRVNGGLTAWPAGTAPYASGIGFHEYLANTYGETQFAALAEQTSRSIPFFGSRAFKPVFGKPLGTLWNDYERQTIATVSAARPAAATRLTHHGFIVLGPRIAPPVCATCPSEIIYAARDPHGFPALRSIAVDGSQPRQLATRYLGSTAGVTATTVVFDQQDLHRNVGLYSDLYVLDRRSGSVRSLTHESRLQDPDLSPDGQSIVCVRDVEGRRDLVLVRLTPSTGHAHQDVGTIDTLISEPDTQFNAPRWSPDGRQVIVERHRLGALSELALVDVATRSSQLFASDPETRFVTPAWRPDGRAVIAAADFGHDTFNLYEFPIDQPDRPRQITQTTGGATWPDVSPDGKMIVFVGYTVDGFDLFSTPYPDTAAGRLVQTAPARATTPSATPETQAHNYSPWRTMPPTSWTPLLDTSSSQVRLGFATNGYDVLQRHVYTAEATWLVDAPSDAFIPSRAEPDWSISYAYARWVPTLFVSASRDTVFAAGPPDAAGRPRNETLLTRQIETGVLVPTQRVRVFSRLLASVIRYDDEYKYEFEGMTQDMSAARTAVRGGLAVTTAHRYGYSISSEGGVQAGATVEVTPGTSASAAVTTVTGDARAYIPGLGQHHVLAIRAGGGSSSGERDERRTFLLGGGSASVDVLDFGRHAFSLLRGFSPDSYAGSHIALVNIDYRFPIARPERGSGTWPLFLHTVHGAAFADAANAWSGPYHAGQVKTSLGGELSLDVVAGYAFRFTLASGAAWGHDAATGRDVPTAYVRVGHAF